MVDPSPRSVECPICGEAFDPTAAGGWCTNDECGEWKYEGEGVPKPDESGTEGTGTVEQDPLGEVTGSPPGSDETDGDETRGPDEADQSGDSVADASAAVNDASAAADEAADEADTARDDVESAAEAVEEELEAAAEQVEDVLEGDAADEREEHDREADESDFEAAADEYETDDRDEETGEHEGSPGDLDAGQTDGQAVVDGICPDCGEPVEPDDNFCASCGTALPEPEPRVTLAECPNCGQAVDEDDSFCTGCGEDLDAHRAEAAAGAAAAEDSHPDRLVLQARGRDLTVEDGDTVGREFRRILSETGGGEEEAVRIHREHVRFVREDGRFYLIDLGDNPTLVNGEALGKGTRTGVQPGDTITLSNVLTVDVAAPSE